MDNAAKKDVFVEMESGELIRLDEIAMFKGGEYWSVEDDWKVIVQTKQGILIESKAFCFKKFKEKVLTALVDIQ